MIRRCARILFTPLLVLLLISAAAPAFAKLVVNKNIVVIGTDGRPRADIELRNIGDDVLYVAVDPARIENPGTDTQDRVAPSDPRELGLLVTPRKLVLQPGDRKIIRMTLLKQPQLVDDVYRVLVEPKASDFDADTDGMKIKIMVGYDILVLATPRTPSSNLKVERDGAVLRIQNDGNSNALLYDGQQCDETLETCKQLPVKRIYAGTRFEMPLPYENTPARFLMLDARGSQAIEY
ncbi:MAG: hypothetical protein ABF335_09805 [Alphaproteobacteria bacterium]